MLLRASLDELSEADREVLRLRLEGYSTQEVADHLGITMDAANSRIHRVQKRVQEQQRRGV